MEEFIIGIIYIIVNSVDGKRYVGSTIQSKEQRFRKHRLLAKHGAMTDLHVHMRNIGIEYFGVMALEIYKCESLKQLRQREEYWRQKLQPELNCQVCYATDEHKRLRRANYQKTRQYPEGYHAACYARRKAQPGYKEPGSRWPS